MLEKYLEPDLPEYRCECGECYACIHNYEWNFNYVDEEFLINPPPKESFL